MKPLPSTVRWSATLVTLAVIGLTPPPAFGQEASGAPRDWLASSQPPALGGGASSPSPWRMAGLALLVAALGGAAVYLKRRGRHPALQGATQLSVVGSVRLGPKAQLVVASVADRLVLLGVTDSSVRKLGWLPEKAAPNEASAPASAPEEGDEAFASVLAGIFRDRDSGQAPSDPSPMPAESLPEPFRRRAPVDERMEPESAPPAIVTITPQAGALAARKRDANVRRPELEGQVLGLARKQRRSRG